MTRSIPSRRSRSLCVNRHVESRCFNITGAMLSAHRAIDVLDDFKAVLTSSVLKRIVVSQHS